MKKFLQVLLYLVGFPLLLGLVVWKSIPIIKAGSSYGIMVYVGIILTVVFAIIYFLATFIMAKRGKKTIYRQTFVSIIIAVICLGGLWAGMDIGVPDLLADATSNTILYEDLADDYAARAQVNKDLLDEYIARNVANGNLITNEDFGVEEYQKQGIKNEKVKSLLEKHFKSIDAGGYATFVGPWLDLANGDRMTIPALVHLIINKREINEFEYPIDEETDPVQWSILDMLGEPMEFDLGPDGMAVIPEDYIDLISSNLVSGIIPIMLTYVNNFIADETVVNSPIYISLENGCVIILTPANESRGALDYQSMAWLNSNGLIFMLVSVFALRKFFLIFAGVLVVTTYAIGLLREGNQKGKKELKQYQKQINFDTISASDIMAERYKPYDPSYVVISQNDDIDYNKMMKQLIVDGNTKVTKKYHSKDFLRD